jgi:propanol-preferring alcohol dehydrogenase
VPAARHLVPLPEALDPVQAAPLTDAGLTPYHAVRRSESKLGPTATAVVIGVGGLGHMAVQVLRATSSARVVAVDPRDAARDLAVQCGADLALAPGPDLVAEIRDFTRNVGADVVIDCVGSDETLAAAAASVRQLGDVTIVGIAGGTLPVSFFGVPYEASVQTTYWGNRRELVEVLDLAARGLLKVETTLYTLEDAAQAYQDLAHGTVNGRAVVVPTDSYRP